MAHIAEGISLQLNSRLQAAEAYLTILAPNDHTNLRRSLAVSSKKFSVSSRTLGTID